MLTEDQCASFHEDGFIHGFGVCSPDEMAVMRREIDEILQQPGPAGEATAHRHLDQALVYQLCAHRAIVDRAASILGADLMLWHSRFFDRPPGSARIEWHQDGHFWPIEPDVCVSAWIAIDRADRTDGCLEFIPGSHRLRVPHLKAERAGRFGL